MTQVGQISVEAKLDSSKFKAELTQTEKKVGELKNSINKSEIAIAKLQNVMLKNGPTERMQNALEKLQRGLKINQNEYKIASSKLTDLKSSIGTTDTSFNMLSSTLGKLGMVTTIGAIATGVFNLGKTALQTSADFEQLETSFAVLTGGKDIGKDLTNQLIELANTTPLTTQGLAQNAQMLLSFGESSKDVIDDLKLLGDVTGGNEERMKSMTLAFSQVGSQGRLMGQDLMQMVNAGFNPLQAMSQKTGKSMGQLKDEMSKGLISFKDVKQAMIDATSEGGRFYGMMNTQSQTLNGRLSTMDDTWSLVSKNIGDIFLPMAGDAVTALTNLGKSAQWATGLVLKLKDALDTGYGKNSSLDRKIEARTNNIISMKETRDIYAQKGNKVQVARYNEAIKRAQKELRELDNDRHEIWDSEKNNLDNNGFSSSSSTSPKIGKQKKQTDKALEEYKHFLELYKSFNNEYESTVKARQAVQNQYGLSPVGKDSQQYDTLVKLYAEKYKRIGEIEMSQAKNKNALYMMNEQQFQKELAELKVSKTQETQQKLYELSRGYSDQTAAFGDNKQAYEDMGGFLGSFSSGYAQRLEILKWYYSERKRIAEESNGDMSAAGEAYSQLDILKNAKMAQANLDVWSQYGHEVSGIMGNTFSSLLSGQSSFGDVMRNMYGQLASQLLKIVWQQALKEIEFEQIKTSIILAFRTLLGFATGGASEVFAAGGAIGDFGGSFVGAIAHSGHKFTKYHSGGLNYSSYDVPGTAEQLALIKGGERVLSPAENVSYEQGGDSRGSKVQVINFNVKAWDGKDVISTLRENAAIIQQITANGIKNNQNGLRTIVQGV